MPAVLAAILLLVSLISNEHPHQALVSGTQTLFGIIVFVWGTRLASDSVISEIKDRTWDSQRMSSIGAWSMTWGKLFGSTIYQWYGGLLCLLVYGVLTIGDPDAKTLFTFALFISAGLFGQSVALLTSLQAVNKERSRIKSQASAFFVLGLIVSTMILPPALNSTSSFRWFGITFQGSQFLLVSVIVFLCWTIFGIYRLMRAELQMRNGPFVWLSFACFLAAYFAGYPFIANGSERLSSRFFVAYVVGVVLTYVMALSERKDPVAIHRLLVSYARKEWRRILQETPCWLITLLPVFIAACGTALTSDDSVYVWSKSLGSWTFMLASFLFLLRDICLILFFNFAKNPKRADMIMILSLGLLYWVIPGIMNSMGFDAATAMFWPQSDHKSFIGVVAAGLELSLVMVLVVKRWKGQYGSIP